MAGRNYGVIVVALQVVAQAAQNNQNGENNEFCNLGMFQRNNPSTFKGMYNPDGARTYLKDIENISKFMACTEALKVQFGTHMLAEKVNDWWDNMRQRLEVADNEITWAVFIGEFSEGYFLEDVRGKKYVKFLELKQGNSIVAEYLPSSRNL